jgi:hypothetical protein
MNVLHYARRMQELGITGSLKRIYERLWQQGHTWYWRRKALAKKAHVSWEALARKHQLSSDFSHFFNQLGNQHYIEKIIASDLFNQRMPSSLKGPERANIVAELLTKTINLFGQTYTFKEHYTIPWHQDVLYTMVQNGQTRGTPFTSPHQSTPTWHTNQAQYYKECTVEYPTTPALTTYAADIKGPWELSRLQHLIPLGLSYDEKKDERYAFFFKEHMESWFDNNPVMLSSTWACPMDVGLRAISMVWCFHLFKHSPSLPLSFWKRFVTTLYDHALFLPRNWELSDKPSNHYLSDLVGYLYLATFFEGIPHFAQEKEWCFERIKEQQKHQIMNDGTSYEGSTSYHKLVTELFMQAGLLWQQSGNDLPLFYQERLAQSFSFLDACAYAPERVATIGDNDSGIVVGGLKPHFSNPLTPTMTHYQDFGLTIIRDNFVHLTLRHPAFTSSQPSGHFHYDMLAITIAHKQTPLIIDPGSFVYTANATWRNYGRSWQTHATFSLGENISPDKPLFMLERIPDAFVPKILSESSGVTITTQHRHYEKRGLIAQRTLTYDYNSSYIELHDQWLNLFEKYQEQISSFWNFPIHPTITLEQPTDNTWLLSKEKEPYAVVTSSLKLTQEQGFYSPAYGVIIATSVLRAQRSIASTEQHITRIELLKTA